MLEEQGVITPVGASEWASPVIAVIKKDGNIRMVIDCKVSLNKILIPNTYPLPLAQDIFASLAGCQVFCCLDLAGAYTQLQLSKRSRKYVVINTLKGLYTYNRLPQGASSSASLFQCCMDQILKGLNNVCCYLDDLLIAGKNFQDCKDKLIQVLGRLDKANIRVNFKKCKFFVKSLQYLGHLVTDKGLLPSPEKLSTISEAKVPENTTELKAYLGLINYYNKFIPHMSANLKYLYELLRKDVSFKWTQQCENAFQDSKKSLLNAKLLTFYDPSKPLVVVTDASCYGLGGVLAQIEDGLEKPICFTSFSLNSAQKKYPILHLEALALVCTIKKFHKFLFGQPFKVFTDHKPLLGIFGKEGRNAIYVTRLQRYIMELSIYNFEIEYRPASKLANADFCSRFPLQQSVPSSLDGENVNSINFSTEFPLDFALVSKETKNDKFMLEIFKYIVEGWPRKVNNKFKDYYSQKEKLQIVDEVLLLDERVVIPSLLRPKVLHMLHKNHGGMIKMKQLARRTVYWPGINPDIEDFVKSCNICTRMENVKNPKEKSSWIPTVRPFSRIHADFFHYNGNVFLLIIDSHTKWLEVEHMRYGTTAKTVIKKFITMFARFGLPDVVVTDGGPPFNSYEFTDFLKRQGIHVLKSPPYHPSSNGQAERLVRVVKDVLKKFLLDDETKSLDIDDRLSLFLINYRNTCNGTEANFPSERVFSYRPKMLMDLINPTKTYKQHLEKSFVEQKVLNNEKVIPPDQFDNLRQGDKLYYKNNHLHDVPRWLDAIFIKKLTRNIFQIALGRHVTTAHRHQLKMAYKPRRMSRLFLPSSDNQNDNKKRRRDSCDEEPAFRGFPDGRFVHDAGAPTTDRRFVHERSPIVTRSRKTRLID
ncbi:uncharacterized protein K02A2.6-like isoform X2 [Uranotaenia lowii]|nr:uncharacterized protein K02A2.6-like isoform X2 [Uranotaenia lowii]XP_055610847.1 uncharacterized protein K02A2.6-like isoform X2 [Uranotaenia lowii]